MLFFLIISCLSFIIFLHNSLYLKQIQLCISEMIFPSLLFLKDLSVVATFFRMSIKNKSLSSKVMNCSDSCSCNISDMCLLDLPDLALECILEKLPPEGLLSMASVCSSMREMCMGDCLWEKRMKKKWGKVIGPAACLKWQWHVEYKKESRFFSEGKEKGLMSYLVKLWPVSLVRSICNSNGSSSLKMKNYSAIDSVMCWYLALESGNFWLPAQVYNRENGHAGFMLSCYDAELCYDSRTDTFQARYPPHGRKSIAIETGVTWDRVRPAPVDVSPYDLHISDCLNELRPGDHIEIQWRRNKEFPYGWWYGVVGHLDQCGGNENYCQCPESDMITLEFSQYAPGSRWRTTIISRKDHKEEGNEADGFYAGIRKLDGGGEISAWNRLRPAEVLE